MIFHLTWIHTWQYRDLYFLTSKWVFINASLTFTLESETIKTTLKKVIFLSAHLKYLTCLSWKYEDFQKHQVLVLLVLLEIQLNIGIMLCFESFNSSIETLNLRACELYREHMNTFVSIFVSPMFRIPVLFFPALYRGEENLSCFLSPHSILRPGVQQHYLLLCEEHIFLSTLIFLSPLFCASFSFTMTAKPQDSQGW